MNNKPKPDCLTKVRAKPYFFGLLKFNPKILKIGQKPVKPVINKMAAATINAILSVPITTWVSTNTTHTNANTILNTWSKDAMFFFIMLFFKFQYKDTMAILEGLWLMLLNKLFF